MSSLLKQSTLTEITESRKLMDNVGRQGYTCKCGFLYMKIWNVCMQKCPPGSYADSERRECVFCAAEDPSQNFGIGGCSSCDQAIFHENETIECIRPGGEIPKGYFLTEISNNEGGILESLAGKPVYRKCSHGCSKCTSGQSGTVVCEECTQGFYKNGDVCEEKCPRGFFGDKEKLECVKCAEECRECHGPTSLDCLACKGFRVFSPKETNDDKISPGNFSCAPECPPELPQMLQDPDGERYCEKGSEISWLTLNWEVSLLAFCVVAIIVAAFAALGWYNCRKRKFGRSTTNIPEEVALTKVFLPETAFLPPNLSKLRIIDETKLRKDKILERGTFGTVHRGIWMPIDGVKIPVGIKELHGINGITDIRSFVDEAFLMATIRHSNLLKMLGLCLGSSGMMMVSQLMPLGSLLSYLRVHKDNIGSRSMLDWCTQIAKGMEHLETCRIIHRDLAARNVVMESPNVVKITDFGLAKLLNLGTEQYQARREMLPIRWLAPECLSDLSFSHKSDVWAFGVTVWEILTSGDTPYDGIPVGEIGPRLTRGERLAQPHNCSIDLYLMLINSWMLNAQARPSFNELVATCSEMSRDPGRYLVIPNDELRRLPRYTLEEEEMLIHRLAMPEDRLEDLMSVEQYTRLDRESFFPPPNYINLQGKSVEEFGHLHYPSMYRSFQSFDV